MRAHRQTDTLIVGYTRTLWCNICL